MSVTYQVPFGTPSRAVTWIEPTASDNSGRTPARTSSDRPGDTFNVGSTQVTYTFSDQAGNSAMCMFTIIIGKVFVIKNSASLNRNKYIYMNALSANLLLEIMMLYSISPPIFDILEDIRECHSGMLN